MKPTSSGGAKRQSIIGYALMIVLFAALIAVSTSCSSASGDDYNGPYYQELKTAYNKATTDFERDVLDDYKITRAEYQEAEDRYLACLLDSGMHASLEEQSGYYILSTPTSEADRPEIDTCRQGTINLIEPLYVDMLTNPDRLTPAENLFNCMKRKGLALPQEYSAGNLSEDMHSGLANAPFNTDDPAFNACLANPAS